MNTTYPKPRISFLTGGGEMGQLTRDYPWHESSLGPPEEWPECLRTSLSIILNSKFPMFLFWGDEHICFYNDAYRPSLGNNGKHPFALGKPGREVWPEIWDFIKPLIDRVMQRAEASFFEDQFLPIFRNGKIEDVYWTFSYSPVFDHSGSPAAVFVTCFETTAKVETVRSLGSANERFKNLVMQAPVAIAVFRGNDFVAEIANDEYLPLVGKAREDFVGRPLFDALPEARERMEHFARKVIETGQPHLFKEVELILNRKGVPEKCYFNSNWEPIREGNGAVDGFMAVVHEVTDQVVARKELEAVVNELEVFKFVADNVTDFIGMCDLDFVPFYVNRSGLKKVGLESLEELSRTRVQDFFFPEDREFIEKDFMPRVLKDGSAETEIRFRHFKTGQPLWFLYSSILLKKENNEPLGYATISKDITVQKLFTEELEKQVKERTKELEVSKQEIQRTAERLNAVFTNAQSGMFTFAPIKDDRGEVVDFRFVITNPKFASYAGVKPEELNGTPASRWFPEYFTNGVFEMYKRSYITGSKERTEINYKSEQLDIYLDLLSTKVGDEVLVTFNDYTPLKAAQLQLESYVQELKRSNRNLEEFAHAASHDLKEPIRKIHFFTDKVKEQLSDRLREEERATFLRIERSTQRMNTLIDDLLLYSHVSQKPQQLEPVDLNSKLLKVMEDLELEIDEKRAIITSDKLPVIRGHRRQMQQMLQNLISNSLKYAKAGVPPKIEITCRTLSANETGWADLSASREDFYVITVKDNGIGFDQHESERIFQMFQRLHGNAEYRGSGVGLSIAQKVAENHNGKIIAHGTPGVGARFDIYLPV